MSKTILIIEDDKFLQDLEVRKLEKSGYITLKAENSREAFEHVEKKGKIDLILLDLLLPDVDGFQILKMLQENPKSKLIPVLVFSNLALEEDIKRAKDLGATNFLIKSNFTLDELINNIKSLIG